jgi:hypothetical protein
LGVNLIQSEVNSEFVSIYVWAAQTVLVSVWMTNFLFHPFKLNQLDLKKLTYIGNFKFYWMCPCLSCTNGDGWLCFAPKPFRNDRFTDVLQFSNRLKLLKKSFEETLMA